MCAQGQTTMRERGERQLAVVQARRTGSGGGTDVLRVERGNLFG